MAVPNIFANATTSIPLSQLDQNFATAITLGNTAVYLGNTTTTIGNVTLTNVTISSGNSTVTKETVTTITSPASTALTIQSNSVTAITIDTSQNVGLGLSPSRKFDVNGSARFVQDNPATTGAITLRQNSADTVGGFIQWVNNANSVEKGWFNVDTSSNMIFATGSSEKMRIDSNGVLCVNGTSASGSISAKERGINPTTTGLGSAAISVYGSYGGGIAMFDSSTASGNGYLLWVDDASNDFNIARGGSSSAVTGGVYINNNAGSWSSRSDERDKINLEPINNAINKVTQLRTVIGEYVWAEGVRHPFLIAQDVQAVLPEAVSIANKSQPEEDQRFGVSYTDVIPLLVAAIKEQQTIIEQLKADIAAIKGAK